MFGHGIESKELVIFGLIGLGVYSQHNNINLANNTTMLIIIFFLFMEQMEIEELQDELCCVEKFTNTSGCKKCGFNGFNQSGFQQNGFSQGNRCC